jgi:DHA1 family bicyclomycin/chloramphenicol resistance-like MFS transporter
VPIATVQLTLSAFVLAFGTMQLILGPVSDRFGRYPVLVGGLAVFAAASLAAALAASIELLIAARVVQAVGCCGVVVAARAIVRDLYSPTDGARILARAATILAIGPLFGPMLGSALEVRYGFRAIFFVLAFVGTALAFATLRQLAETRRAPEPGSLRIAALATAYATVLRSRQFRAYTLVSAASFATLFAFISGSSFVLIGVLHVPTEWFGACFALVVCGYLAGTLVCRRLLARQGLVRAIRRGAALSLASGLALLVLMLAGVHHWSAVLLPTAGVFAAHGVNLPCGQAGSVAPFPRLAGAAAGMYGFLMMALAAPVGALIGGTHNGTVYPMAITMAACTLVTFVAAYRGVARLAPG